MFVLVYCHVSLLPLPLLIFCSIQVEVDEDPAEAKKDDQDGNVEVSCWLLISLLLMHNILLLNLISKCHLLLFQQKKKKTKTVVEKYWDWELTNETQPIWVSL